MLTWNENHNNKNSKERAKKKMSLVLPPLWFNSCRMLQSVVLECTAKSTLETLKVK